MVMYTPIMFLEELFNKFVIDDINVDLVEAHALVFDDPFHGFSCIIKVVSSVKPIERDVAKIESSIANYCMVRYEFLPTAYTEFPRKVGNSKFWVTKLRLNIPHRLFHRYINCCKLKNRTDKIEQDYKFLTG